MAVVLLTVSNILVNLARRETARALAQVKEEQGRTQQALQRADANFHSARQAVEDYFTTVSEEILLDEPGMQGLRGKLLGSALKYHEKFFEEHSGDPGVEAELAESHRRYANINRFIGRGEDPLPHLRIARERFEDLAQRHPESPDYRQQLARTLYDIAEALPMSERKESLRLHRAAVTFYEQLLRERPDDDTILDGLAMTLVRLGLLVSLDRGGTEEGTRVMQRARDTLQRLIAKQPGSLRPRIKLSEIHEAMYSLVVGDGRRQDEALRSSQDALSVFNDLLKRVPQSPRFKRQVGAIHTNRALLYARARRLVDSIQEARQARSILSDLVRTNPEDGLSRGKLAAASMILGTRLQEIGASEEALGPLRESCDALEQLLNDHPGNITFNHDYSTALGNLGSSLMLLGRYVESTSVFERAAEVHTRLYRQDPGNVFGRGDLMTTKFNLAVCLTRAGRHGAAVTAYQESRSIGKELFGEECWSHGNSVEGQGNISMAYSLRELGRNKEAEQALARAKKARGDEAASLYEMARYQARGARRLAEAGGDARAIDDLERRALRSLRRAIALGFSEIPSVHQLGETFHLRDRPEFKLALLDMAFPAQPFAPSD